MRDVFDGARALAPDARRAYLESACAGDDPLRGRVEELLGAYDVVGEPADAEEAPTARPSPPRPADPVAIGPYRILERIGEGGFGTVYLAEQTQPIHRRVALKVLRVDAPSASVLARFEAERQALALMEHPHIAVVHDAGTTDAGQPYIVMEHVAGAPITTCADEHRLDLEERLRLFRQLCDAVQHAHQRAIIHRDLKPSNVLVARVDGRFLVKVIDFGIAKALGTPLTDATMHTLAGSAMGTPEYMSPEQTSASPGGVDTRTDVYSLGIILYELLVGAVPFARDPSSEGSLFDVLREIREKEPPRPTTRLRSLGAAAERVAERRRLDPAALRRRLRGDLEWITLKALEKDPARRYATAAALGEDVARFLGNHPILARPPSTSYQLRKLVSRHRAIATLAATLVLVLAGFAVAMSAMYARQRVERLRAERVGSFLEEMLASADPVNSRGQDVLVRDVLDGAAAKLATELPDEPEAQAALEYTLARTYVGLGLYAEADSLVRRALAASERTRGARGRAQAARCRALLGDVLVHRGRLEEAEPVLRRALAEREAVLGRDHPEVATSRALLGDLLHRNGEYEEAEREIREALRVRAYAGLGQTPAYAETLILLGALLKTLGRYPETEALHREALDIQRRALPPDHPDVTQSMNELAIVLRHEGEYDEAESLYREALAIDERVYGHEHPLTAQLMANLGLLLKSRRRYAEAESLYTESLRIRRAVLGEEHPGVATLLNNLSSLYREQGRLDEAERVIRAALATQRRIHGDEHADVALAIFNLAGVLHEIGRDPAEAETLSRQALAMRRALLGDGHPDVAASAGQLGGMLLGRGDPGGAEPLFREAVAIRRATYEEGDWRTGTVETQLGECALALGRFAEADSLLAQGAPAVLDSEATTDGSKRRVLRALAALADSLRRPEAAREWRARLDALAAP